MARMARASFTHFGASERIDGYFAVQEITLTAAVQASVISSFKKYLGS